MDVVLTLLTEMEWFWNKVSEGEKFFEKKVSKYLFVSAKCITFAAGKLSKTKIDMIRIANNYWWRNSRFKRS